MIFFAKYIVWSIAGKAKDKTNLMMNINGWLFPIISMSRSHVL